MSEALKQTLGSRKWMIDNKQQIKNLLPETWTHIKNINGMKLGFGLKLLGVDWRSEKELAMIMVFFEKTGIMLRDGYLVRRNHNA